MYIKTEHFLLLLIPVLLFQPFWNMAEQLNRAFIRSIKDGLGVFENNLMLTILVFVIAYLATTNK